MKTARKNIFGEEARRKLARDYGLPENAGWEEIYTIWRRPWTFRPIKTFLVASGFAILPYLVFTHWITAIFSGILFAVIVFLNWLFHSLSYFALEAEYSRLLGLGGQPIINCAKRDGIIVLISN